MHSFFLNVLCFLYCLPLILFHLLLLVFVSISLAFIQAILPCLFTPFWFWSSHIHFLLSLIQYFSVSHRSTRFLQLFCLFCCFLFLSSYFLFPNLCFNVPDSSTLRIHFILSFVFSQNFLPLLLFISHFHSSQSFIVTILSIRSGHHVLTPVCVVHSTYFFLCLWNFTLTFQCFIPSNHSFLFSSLLFLSLFVVLSLSSFPCLLFFIFIFLHFHSNLLHVLLSVSAPFLFHPNLSFLPMYPCYACSPPYSHSVLSYT